jgi:hypothetical protein
MVSEAPVQAASSLLTLTEKVKAFVVIAKAKASDGLTVAEFGELVVALLRVAIQCVDAIPADGAGKKTLVVDAVAELFDAVADRCVPLAAWPVWFLVRPTVRSLVLLAAGGAVESLLPLVRKAAAT